MRKKWMLVMAVSVLTMAVSVPAYAGEWKKNDKGWWWEAEDGSYPTDCAMRIGSEKTGESNCCYFDSEGYLITNTRLEDGTYIDENGYAVYAVEDYSCTLGQNYKDAGVPDEYCGTYFGKNNGVTESCFIYVWQGYYNANMEFRIGAMPPYVGNGVFEDEDDKFIFSGNHLTVIDKIFNETYELSK